MNQDEKRMGNGGKGMRREQKIDRSEEEKENRRRRERKIDQKKGREERMRILGGRRTEEYSIRYNKKNIHQHETITPAQNTITFHQPHTNY